jgi:hypothetical protein
MAHIYQTDRTIEQGKKPKSVLKRKVRKYFYIALTFVLLIIGGIIYWSFFFTYSDGTRTGVLQKFSRKGTIFKTYEGELILSSVKSTNGVALASDRFIFSVNDKDVAKQIEQLQGENVDLHYKETKNTLPWRGESVYIVTGANLHTTK